MLATITQIRQTPRLAGHVRAEGDLAFAAELMDQLPEQSLGLAELATVVTQTVFDHLAGNPDESAAYRAERARVANNLANRLSALGRREAALTAAEEAVELRRRLAQERPDAFTPDLAMSLGALGAILKQGDQGAGRDRFAEAIALLSPLFLRLPQAFAPLMGALRHDYLDCCQQLGEAPDAALLGPLEAMFETLPSGEDGPGKPG